MCSYHQTSKMHVYNDEYDMKIDLEVQIRLPQIEEGGVWTCTWVWL